MEKQKFNPEKYLKAQMNHYENALKEIRNGRKESHWIWYIFPQITGLGKSSMSEFYAIQDLDQAKAYLQNAILKKRLIEISEALLEQNDTIHNIMGSPDDFKVCSCMTLFYKADSGIPIFQKVIRPVRKP